MAEIYVARGDTKTYVTFASSIPHKTRFLMVSYMLDDKPEALIADLNDIGWGDDEGAMLPLIKFSPLNGRTQDDFHAKGSELFGYWTDDERKTHMSNVRRALRKHGFKSVPHWKLTMADMM